MILPAPLLVTLEEGTDSTRKAAIIDRMHDITGVIHALPRTKEQDPTGRQIMVVYAGGGVAEELRKIPGVADIKDSPSPIKRNRFPSP
jgi:hypothetical protein